ncbi:toll-like receptor 4 [Patella vulgata]|uniref:toll-like receptor 4 n=1 Tax=Patella vulgata TaxID=6465 RepID=UPI00218015D5|nr:toll-like receptor 4 [Patella vulgata]
MYSQKNGNVFVLLVFIPMSIKALVGTCLLGVDMHYGGTKAKCSRIGISRVPGNLPDNTTTLEIAFNNIEILHDNEFQYLTHLKCLDISFNPIHKLQGLAFNGLHNLLVLEFNAHALNYTKNSMPLDVFTPLQSLTNLSLRSDVSRFTGRPFDLPHNALARLKKLRQLNIDTGPNTVFKSGFSNLTELRELFIGVTWKHGKRIECGLSNITRQTFDSFSKIPVSLLQLNSCRLHNFDENYLEAFPRLKVFLFNKVHLINGNLSMVLNTLRVFKHKYMTEIGINSVVTSLPYMGFDRRVNRNPLSEICVTQLDLSSNLISLIDFDGFCTTPDSPLMKCLKRITLAGNRLVGKVSLNQLPLCLLAIFNIEEVDLSDQKIFSFAKYISLVPHTSRGDSERKLPDPFIIFAPPKLSYLNVAALPHGIGELDVDIHFILAKKLKYFNVSYCGLYNLKRKVFGLENLEVLDLSGNSLSIINDTFLDTFPNLKKLRLSNILLDNEFITQSGIRFFSPLEKLETLDLSSNDLVVLPNDLFNSLVALQVINLADNKLISIPDLNNLVKLNSLYLNHNSFTTLRPQHTDMLDKTAENNPKFYLSISGNTFTCACETFLFLLWLDKTMVKLDGRNYSCIESTGKMTFTKNVSSTLWSFHRQCMSSFLLNLTIGGSSAMLVTLMAAFVFIKNKMKLKLMLLRLIGQNIYPKKREEFIYDAFIIYTDSMSSWVCNELRNELETDRGIKLNLRDRDHIPGGSQAEDMLEAMRDSWKIVLILTVDFLKSDLAYFTMCNCLSFITLTTPHRLIVIIDDQLNIPTNIDFLLEAVTENNIVCVDLQQPFIWEFWEKLSVVIKQKEITV